MRAPPAVSHPALAWVMPGWLVAAGAAALGAVLAAWAMHRPDLPAPWWLGAGAGVLWLAAVTRRRAPAGGERGWLQWDGTAWHWQALQRMRPQPLSGVRGVVRTRWGVLVRARRADGRHAWWWCPGAPQDDASARALWRALAATEAVAASAIVGARRRP